MCLQKEKFINFLYLKTKMTCSVLETENVELKFIRNIMGEKITNQ